MNGFRAVIVAGAVLASAPAFAAPTTVSIEPLASAPFSIADAALIPKNFGSTATVTLDWNPLNDFFIGLRQWPSEYSGGRAAAFCAAGENAACLLDLKVEAGSTVTLDSFFLGSYADVDRAITFTVIDLFNSTTVATGSPTVGAAGLSATIGATSSVGFRIAFGPDGYNGGINDIVFSSASATAVPAPPALALFGIGLLGLGLIARRRAAA